MSKETLVRLAPCGPAKRLTRESIGSKLEIGVGRQPMG